MLTNILINLYGEEFRRDFDEHLELLKEINTYYRRKRANIEEEAKNDFLVDKLYYKYCNIFAYLDDDCYWSYSEWFKEVFLEDYDKALIEVEQQTIPSDRELCILRIAREATYKKIDIETINKFCGEYLNNTEECVMFWIEYWNN